MLLLSGCATTSNPNTNSNIAGVSDADPFQSFNRKMNTFNLTADRILLRPIAKTYANFPQPIRNGIGNFFSNLTLPATIVFDILQGKFAQAQRDTGRFLINTILGAGGLMDVATELDLPSHREDLGQTLAVWGVPSGPYLVLPLLGPSTPRDALSLFSPFSQTDPILHLPSPDRWYGQGLRVLNARANLLGLDDLLDLQTDQYLFLREEYRQRRIRLIHDGNPPRDLEAEEELLDELFD